MNEPASGREAAAAPGFFDELPGGCLVVDAAGRIVRANATLAAWLGRAPGELVGIRFPDLLPVGGKLFYANHHRVREDLVGETEELSYDLLHADGSRVPVLLSTRALDDGRRVYSVFRAEMRRRYEAQLLEAKKAAEEANRARATFLNTVTHEVRTPIHAVLGLADLLGGTDLDAQQAQLVEILADSGNTLLGLVNDVLDLSRAESTALRLHPKPTDLPGLVDALLATLRPSLPSTDVELTGDVLLGCPRWVLVDAGKLRQVLTNLLSNAIKFTERGAVTLRVTCRGPASEADDRLAFTFSVADTGPGIPAREHATVFAPFGQASGAHAAGGTGLGLPISQRIVRALGGEITLDSEVGRGSTFAFTLVLPESGPERARAPAVAAALSAHESARLRGRSVLVVDDNPTNLFIARRHLRALDVDVVEAGSGAEAVALARERRFDLVLMDLRMPELDGYAAAALLRGLPLHAATPVVAVTAASYPEARAPEEEGRFVARLLKPFTAAQLRGALLEHLTVRREERGAGGGAAATAAPAEGDDAAIDRETLLAEFPDPDDLPDLREFLGMIRADFLRERGPLAAAIRDGDVAEVRERRHKLMPTLKLLRPRPLRDLLDEAVAAEPPPDREALARALEAAVAATIALVDALDAELAGEG